MLCIILNEPLHLTCFEARLFHFETPCSFCADGDNSFLPAHHLAQSTLYYVYEV